MPGSPAKGHTAPTGSLPAWREPPGRGPQGSTLAPASSSGPSSASLSDGSDWGQEEKGTTEDEMAGWHHQLDGHEFE